MHGRFRLRVGTACSRCAFLRDRPDPDRLIEYEAKLNNFFPGSKALAICQYDVRLFSPQTLLAILETHPVAAIGAEIHPNPYYMSPDLYLAEDRAQHLLHRRIAAIKERSQTEKWLAEQEKEHRHLLENLHAAVVVFEADTRISFCNKKAQEMLGISKDEIMDKMAGDTMRRLYREDGTRLPLKEYPVVRVLDTRKPISNMVFGIENPTSKEITWSLINAYPEIKNNVLERIVVIFMDISERKLAEERLRRHETIVKNSTDMLALVDREHTYRVVNSAYASLFGKSPDEIIGMRQSSVTPPRSCRP